jgi:phosphoserine phosphatase RsbU/P
MLVCGNGAQYLIEMKRNLQFILTAAFFALLLINGGSRAVRTVGQLGMQSEPGWTPLQVGNEVFVRLGDSAEMTRLRNNDQVIAIESQPIKLASQVADAFKNIEPGKPYSMVVRRGGQFLEFTLSSRPIPSLTWIINVAASLIIPNIFLLTGLAVFLLKPFDKQAILLSLMFGMFIVAIGPSFAGQTPLITGVMLTVNTLSLFLWPIFFHFFLIFPEPSPVLRYWPRLERYLYLPHLLTIFPYFATLNMLAAFSPQKFLEFRDRFIVLPMISMIVATLYFAGGLLSLFVNYRQAGRASRRRMRVVVAGSVAGFLPTFLVIGLAVIFNLPRANPEFAKWLLFVAFLSFPLFPLSFAYAIVRHQIIPVRLIVRRSVRYLLVSRGFIIVQAAVVFAVLSFLLTGSRLEYIDSLGQRADIIVTMAATALAIALLTLVNQQVMPLIDRRFFRESYDAQQVLAELGSEIRAVTAIDQLLERAAAKIHDALHVENVAIFLNDANSHEYICVHSSRATENGLTNSDTTIGTRFKADGYVIERVRHSSNPLTLDFQRPRSWLQAGYSPDARVNESRHQELSLLRRMRSTILVPVATKDELIGVISLGARLGDLPFSSEDKQLLMAIAWQMAFAVQNALLVRKAAEQERLRHELEIATNVQQRLFPQGPPNFESFDLAGVCHPARGVGGDYYDFITLGPHQIGIAVADVAGKGISAALLMSTVQASLRSQVHSTDGDLTKLVSRMNELLHSSTDASSFATFFYAQFDENTGLLTYVNAGHNPPMLVRAGKPLRAQGVGQSVGSGEVFTLAGELAPGHAVETAEAEIRLLTTGGLIIGAFNGSEYEQEAIRMGSGDVLVAYTDGVTEAANSFDEEFGEDRLRALVAISAGESAVATTERIVEAVREWRGEISQHDDLTLVVMKVR